MVPRRSRTIAGFTSSPELLGPETRKSGAGTLSPLQRGRRQSFDASALAALVRGRLSAVAWFVTAKTTSSTLYLPALALAEVRAVRPEAGSQLAEALDPPSVVLATSTPSAPARSTGCFSTLTFSTAAPDTSSISSGLGAGQPRPQAGCAARTVVSSSTCLRRPPARPGR
jgi:hypothetical protein